MTRVNAAAWCVEIVRRSYSCICDAIRLYARDHLYAEELSRSI